MQVFFIPAVYEQAAPATDHIYNRSVQLFGDGGATFTAAEATPLLDMFFTHIAGGMHNDGPAEDIVIPTLFFSF